MRWINPYEWLLEHFRDAGPDERARIATLLMQQVDGDAIQDLFQKEMDKDGYFDGLELLRCPEAFVCSGRSICNHGGPHSPEAACWTGYADCPPCEPAEEER